MQELEHEQLRRRHACGMSLISKMARLHFLAGLDFGTLAALAILYINIVTGTL